MLPEAEEACLLAPVLSAALEPGHHLLGTQLGNPVGEPSWGTQSGSPVGEPSRGTQLAVGGSLICVAPQHAQSKRCLRTGGSMEAGLECLARGESIGRE